MKTIFAIIGIIVMAGCSSPVSDHTSTSFFAIPVKKNFDGNYTGINIVGVVYKMTLTNTNGTVSGQMTADELHETWVVSGTAVNNLLSGKISHGDIWTFELEAEAIPGDVIRFNPKNDLGMGDINFKQVD